MIKKPDLEMVTAMTSTINDPCLMNLQETRTFSIAQKLLLQRDYLQLSRDQCRCGNEGQLVRITVWSRY